MWSGKATNGVLVIRFRNRSLFWPAMYGAWPKHREIIGYYDEKTWETMSESERDTLIDECFAYDDVLRKNGHFLGGEGLQSARNATTLRWKNGKVSITDGPYAETKEQLGGLLILDAKDLNHAIQLMSKHPGVKAGPFEIRPAEDCTEMKRESERRRAATTSVRT